VRLCTNAQMRKAMVVQKNPSKFITARIS